MNLNLDRLMRYLEISDVPFYDMIYSINSFVFDKHYKDINIDSCFNFLCEIIEEKYIFVYALRYDGRRLKSDNKEDINMMIYFLKEKIKDGVIEENMMPISWVEYPFGIWFGSTRISGNRYEFMI